MMSKEMKAVRSGDMIIVENPVCVVCGNGSQVRVDWMKYQMWQGGGLIDRVFPNMSAGQRETMISGTHPYCWTQLMGEDNES